MEGMKGWEILLAVIGAIGGLEGIRYLLNWRANRRSELARATGNELQTLKETCEFLQRQLLEKEQRFVEQTSLLRSTQREVLEITRLKAEAEIAFAKEKAELEIEMVKKRCNDLGCPFREPPNAYTQPKEGMSKEEYHYKKTDTNNINGNDESKQEDKGTD